ncbi:uncharacterized protein L3040_005957 [Drepanopeziza brunnea f. sp. 'multigermtubi']|uniref:Integral membrane protein n=1 Tax=Marssonina brunnea f. sp. multigermtubi (strain MB_m1) TaxID=1072389 RepID=K1Y0F2_MARBU|nr:uncharacterized protein MBM_03577 [Drepanopeziza brunnea f. sp. 'multigermtubi' MB_m1]EKD18584.1 integral membrane protein [Drepanopeziza brunnea f. sp. 'multigermtubi' MB_m1]KAJ5040299.1 hypothetical protein L3040_005957 [Drepanopeziza brunnea f. sp. 'multigermtubi']
MADRNPNHNHPQLNVPDPNPDFQDAVPGRVRTDSPRSQGSSILSPVTVGSAPERPRAYGRRPSIRIRRLSSVQNFRPGACPVEGTSTLDFAPGTASNDGNRNGNADLAGAGEGVRRNRSFSDPHRGALTSSLAAGRCERYMPDVTEEPTAKPAAGPREKETSRVQFPDESVSARREAGDRRPISQPTASFWRPLRRARTNIEGRTERDRGEQAVGNGHAEYEADLVDLLDLVDPEVSTLQTLTNVQNSLFVPDLGRYLNRRPTYNLTRRPTKDDSTTSSDDDTGFMVAPKDEARPAARRMASGATLNTISSNVNENYYAVLPHGVRLSDWSEEEKLELNDHVRHMLHSRRSKFKRSMKGFKQYVSKPLGFFVTLYAVLITAFGLAWVLFLIGWVNVSGSRKEYMINVIDNVLVALFAIVGDGLAPFRAVDTYHMCFIAHYHRLTWRLRREKSLPKLANDSDLPAVQPEEVQDVEKQEFSVLSPEQVEKLQHHQQKFAKSHSFYKPHETSTHYAFPLWMLVAIVVLLDCHSILQISLGLCTWTISYHVRPFALTTVILCCSITVNTTAGILITVGDHKTRKKDVRERMVRQDLTADAIRKMEKKRRHELKKAGLIRDGEEEESALDVPDSEGEGKREKEGESELVRRIDPGADSLVKASRSLKGKSGTRGKVENGEKDVVVEGEGKEESK